MECQHWRGSQTVYVWNAAPNGDGRLFESSSEISTWTMREFCTGKVTKSFGQIKAVAHTRQIKVTTNGV